MNINQIKKAATVAKSRTNDARWINAINRAVEGVESGKWIVTELHDHILVTTESGETYHSNGVCQCKAYTDGGKSACKHRALYRLIQIANELPVEQPEVVATKAATSRESIIADIKSTWSSRFPGESLADELMRRFRKNRLEMLSIDFLVAVRAAIA